MITVCVMILIADCARSRIVFDRFFQETQLARDTYMNREHFSLLKTHFSRLIYQAHTLNLYCIVSIHLYSASCSAHQSEALPVRETQREESNLLFLNCILSILWVN